MAQISMGLPCRHRKRSLILRIWPFYLCLFAVCMVHVHCRPVWSPRELWVAAWAHPHLRGLTKRRSCSRLSLIIQLKTGKVPEGKFLHLHLTKGSYRVVIRLVVLSFSSRIVSISTIVVGQPMAVRFPSIYPISAWLLPCGWRHGNIAQEANTLSSNPIDDGSKVEGSGRKEVERRQHLITCFGIVFLFRSSVLSFLASCYQLEYQN